MPKIILFILVFLYTIGASSQTPLNFCGTNNKSPWLVRYQKHHSSYEKRNGSTLYLPISIHIVGTDTGSGYFSFNGLMNALCTLNEDFLDTDIQFFIEGDITYIDNSIWYNHDYMGGSAMMAENNIDETINCYIVESPAGNCGYSSYGSGIALAKDCIGPNDHTWAHELGHFLSLAHTFYGWEGGISPDNPRPNYKNPAPDTVFVHNQPILVEKVDGSNCADAADGFCDTPPDYIFNRWRCDEEGKSFEMIDPNAESFQADGSLFMSYSNDGCANRFSPEQMDAMRANAISEKQYFTDDIGMNFMTIQDSPILTSPIDSLAVFPTDILLEWEPVENADHYIVVVSRFKSFSNLDFKGKTDDNFIRIPKLKKNKKYYWKIYPWSKISFCSEYSEPKQFSTTLQVANDDIQNSTNISIYPNLITHQEPIRIQTNSQKSSNLFVQISDITGRLMLDKQFENISNQEIEISTQHFSSGIYMVYVHADDISFVEKIIIN